ncbi:MAG: hypothetical protein JWL68_3785 [Actinomycetia bacterium]|nr:hypothetical protein [Actinomycetes bacterium]
MPITTTPRPSIARKATMNGAMIHPPEPGAPGPPAAEGNVAGDGRTRTAISRIRWYAVSLVTGIVVFLAGAPAALAMDVPLPGTGGAGPAVPPPVIPLAAAGGMPGWLIVLIALGSALAASALTLLALRITRRATAPAPAHS